MGINLSVWWCFIKTYSQLFLSVSILLLGTASWAQVGVTGSRQVDDTNGASELWGGQDVRLQLTDQGATIEFDCAEGRISQLIKPDEKGEFTARGSYTPGQFGAIQKAKPPRELPAIYKGTISDNTMHLQVILENKDTQPPPFTLIKGKQGRVLRCH